MREINAKDFVCPGRSDSAVIRAALSAAGFGDTVRIPRFNGNRGKAEWRISETLMIPSGVTLLLDNAALILETGTYCNMLSAQKGTENIAVVGEGNALISGGEWNYLSGKMAGKYGLPDVRVNALLRFTGVKGLRIQGLRFEMARWASLLLEDTAGAELKNLFFDMIPHVQELYGVFLGCGCQRIAMENLTGRTGDDCVLIFGDDSRYPEGGDISEIRIRNLSMDSNRGSLVHIRTNGGHKVSKVSMDTLVDSSDFFEKKRIRSNCEIGTCMAELRPARLGEISGISLVNAYSAAYFTVALDGPADHCRFERIWTFGDNINIVKSNAGAEVRDLRFRRLYWGAGSEPNNAGSFISRYAKGARPVELERVKGDYSVEKLFLQEEEDHG